MFRTGNKIITYINNNNMNKLFTFCVAMLFAVATNAQQVRKVWDFTKGFSAETKSNLAADAKSGSGVWTDMSEQGFYQSKARTAGPACCLISGEQ